MSIMEQSLSYTFSYILYHFYTTFSTNKTSKISPILSVMSDFGGQFELPMVPNWHSSDFKSEGPYLLK